jgi:hypothetical protein
MQLTTQRHEWRAWSLAAPRLWIGIALQEKTADVDAAIQSSDVKWSVIAGEKVLDGDGFWDDAIAKL